MRLKDIPKGTKVVFFKNEGKKDAFLTFKYTDGRKEVRIFVRAESFKIIEARTYLVSFPMEQFPHIRIWGSQYVDVEVR